jgi:hypothetical protein
MIETWNSEEQASGTESNDTCTIPCFFPVLLLLSEKYLGNNKVVKKMSF